MMPKCPYCGSGDLTPIKSWRFRFYDVAMYRCNRCGGEFNHYVNTMGKGKPEYYVRIKPRLKRGVPSATSGSGHEDVKGWLAEIGKVLGYYTKAEYESGGYRFDVAWLLWEGEPPIAVFEVVIRGDVDKSIQRLLYAYRGLRAKGLFLIVANSDDEARARSLIEGTYKELKGKVDIWYVNKVKELMNALSKYRNELMKLATLGR